MSFRIFNDDSPSNLFMRETLRVPNIGHTAAPGSSGNVFYDPSTQLLYYSTGMANVPLQTGGGLITNIDGFSLSLNAPINIPSGVPTILSGFSAAVPYSTIPDWNIATGMYTATVQQKATFFVALGWGEGITNQGTRTVSILLNSNPVITSSTQAVPDKSKPTPQIAIVTLALNPGDQVQIQAFQDSGVGIPIKAGPYTIVSGSKLF